MWLSDSYDVPKAVVDDPPSPAFRQYLLKWFGSNHVSFSERLRTANNLTPEETALARQLIRRNLKCGYSHIVSGTWALDDLEAGPMLRVTFDAEPDESRRLVIAGALWKLNRDPVFIECLNRAKESGLLSSPFHLEQILWLYDECSIDFLIDLLPAAKGTTPWALSLLNRIETGRHLPRAEQKPPSYYWERRNDLAFREMMLQLIHKSIAQMHQGH